MNINLFQKALDAVAVTCRVSQRRILARDRSRAVSEPRRLLVVMLLARGMRPSDIALCLERDPASVTMIRKTASLWLEDSARAVALLEKAGRTLDSLLEND